MKKLAMKMLSLLLVLSLLLPTCVFAQPGQDGDGTPGTQSTTSEKTTTFTEGEDADVSEEEAAPTVVEMEEVVLDLSDMDLPDNDELFAAYVEREFDRAAGGTQFPVLYSSSHATRLLNKTELKIYTILKEEIAKVAEGSRSSTEITITTSWTASELGYADFTDSGAQTAFSTAVRDFDLGKINTCLLADCPYELYWFDKTKSASSSGGSISIPTSGTTTTVNYTFRYPVASGYGSGYTTNAVPVRVNNAVAKASSIIANYAAKTNREKLDGYFKEICTLVDYNFAALATGTPYGDPWQLINVFDNDPATKVVCEGYAKAFQYLCEKSAPQIKCYNVYGDFAVNGSDLGAHMWNIVEMGGTRYLVDVTNCDSYTKDGVPSYGIGYKSDTDGYLYMVTGTPDATGQKHTINYVHTGFVNPDTTVVYTYDLKMKDLFCEGYPKLGTEVKHAVTITNATHMTVTSGSLTQEVLNTAPMTEVILTAADGYYFPVGYTVPGSSGVTVTRLDYRQIKVSGTPTADATIALTAPKAKTLATLTTAPAPNTGLKYNGNAQELVTAGSGVTGGTLQYSLSSGTDFSTAIPKGTNAGNYVVYYKVVGDDTHNDTAEQTINVSIGQKTPEASDFVFAAPGSLGYDGNNKEASVTLKSPYSDAGAVTVKYYNSTGTTEVTERKDVGTYVVKVDVAGGTNFKSISGLTDSAWKFTIAPGEIPAEVVNGVTGYSGTYDGNPHDAVVVNPAATSGYTLAYKGSGSATYSSTMPQVTDVADSGDVWVKLSKTNYEDKQIKVTATVSPKPLTNSMITIGTQKTYNGSEQGVALSFDSIKDGTKNLTGGTDYIVKSGNRATDVGNTTLVIEGKGNYTGEASGTWSLKKATPQDIDFDIPPLGSSHDYTGNPRSVLAPTLESPKTKAGEVTVYYEGTSGTTYAASTTAPTDVGSYKVTFNVTGGQNFNAATGLNIGTLTINPKDVSSLTAVAPDQNTVLNVGSFVEPTIKGVKNEVLAGVLKYTITAANGATAVTNGDYAAATGSLATLNKDKAVSVSYTFTPSSGNYTGSKTGSFTVTAKDIEFTVNGAAASVGNALTVKSSPVYGDDWSDIVKIKDGVTITAKVGTNNDTDPSHFTLKQTGKPGVGSQAYTLAYNGTINGVTYSDVTVLSGTVTVAQKDVTITGLGAANKEYDGNTTVTITGTAAVAGKVGSDDVTVTGGTATFDNKNVGAGKTVTFSGYGLGGTAAGNYKLTAQPASVTAEITAKEVTVTSITAADRSYEKDNLEVTLTSGALYGVLTGDTVTIDLTNAKGKMANANAGTGKAVTVTGVALGGTDKGNYRLKEQPTGVTVDIAQAATPAAPTGLTGVKGNALSTVTLPSGWTWVNGSTVMNTVGLQTFKANYTDAAGNYANATGVNVMVDVKDKTDVSGKISFNDGTLVYTGAGQKYETASISGITAGTGVTWTYGYTAGTGTLDGGLPMTVGTYTATVTYEDSLNYGTKSVTLTITQATPTGAPKFTKITSSGKTLGDAALVKTVSGSGDGFSVAGTVEWVDGSGAALADSTSVEANKSYGWKFTPADSNYKSISGSVVVYTVRRVSHSGGAAADSAAAAAAQPTVYSGSRGESVKTLQERLNAKGFNAGSVDGIFGKNTQAAVMAFQKANGLVADGIVGKLTWAKLYDTTAALPAASTATGTQPMVYRGSRGDAVRKLQELLNKKGFDCGAVDGIFGSKTYAAVVAFQKANGLAADGIVGPLTWGKLG